MKHIKLIGYYNEYGYTTANYETKEEIYQAGNNPLESSSSVPLDRALPLQTMKEYCEITGNSLAKEKKGIFIGSEYEEYE